MYVDLKIIMLFIFPLFILQLVIIIPIPDLHHACVSLLPRATVGNEGEYRVDKHHHPVSSHFLSPESEESLLRRSTVSLYSLLIRQRQRSPSLPGFPPTNTDNCVCWSAGPCQTHHGRCIRLTQRKPQSHLGNICGLCDSVGLDRGTCLLVKHSLKNI